MREKKKQEKMVAGAREGLSLCLRLGLQLATKPSVCGLRKRLALCGSVLFRALTQAISKFSCTFHPAKSACVIENNGAGLEFAKGRVDVRAAELDKLLKSRLCHEQRSP